jgi:hypothetical protein
MQLSFMAAMTVWSVLDSAMYGFLIMKLDPAYNGALMAEENDVVTVTLKYSPLKLHSNSELIGFTAIACTSSDSQASPFQRKISLFSINEKLSNGSAISKCFY